MLKSYRDRILGRQYTRNSHLSGNQALLLQDPTKIVLLEVSDCPPAHNLEHQSQAPRHLRSIRLSFLGIDEHSEQKELQE